MVYLCKNLQDLSFLFVCLFVYFLFYLSGIIQQYLVQLDFWHYFIFTSRLQDSHAALDKYFQVSLTKVIMMSAELKESILITNSLVFHLLCVTYLEEDLHSLQFTTEENYFLYTMKKKCFMTLGSHMDSGAWNQVDNSHLYISKSGIRCSGTDIYPLCTFFTICVKAYPQLCILFS